MDNELYTLNNVKQCETCNFWKQFNYTTGFCDNNKSHYDETIYDVNCDLWEQKL